MRKLFLTLVVIGLAAAAQATATPEAVSFKDLSVKNPAYPYVMQMVVSYEAISGYPDKTFRGTKTITRAEFAKVLNNSVAYWERKYGKPLAETITVEVVFKDLPKTHWAYPAVEKMAAQYKLFSGYPNGTFRPTKTLTLAELDIVLARTWQLVQTHFNLPVVSAEAVTPTHWTNKGADRFAVAVAGAKLINRAEAAIAALPPPPPVVVSQITKAVEIPTKPQTSISGAFGNVYESASGTNNWRNLSMALTYDSPFKLWSLMGDCELTGKYWLSQINYLLSSGGSLVDENRLELEFNTIYPVVDFKGINGKLLLGAKYLSLSNPVAPTNFIGFNAGLVTVTKAFGRNILLRGFWSLPLVRATVSPSVLGQPAQLFDYEASIDQQLFSYPVLLGLSGELMTFTNAGSRWYNMAFVRYYLF